jgi:hypothetical protein
MKTRMALVLMAALLAASGAGAQVFKDLPGVVPTEEYEQRDQMKCEASLERPDLYGSDRMPRTIYTCTQNGITTSSTRMPLSRDRAMRGLDW